MLMGGFFVCSGMQAERTAKKFSDIVQEAPRMICLWAPHAAVLRNFFQSTLGCPRSGCVEHRHILAPVFCLLLCCGQASRDLYRRHHQPWQTLVGSTSSSFKQRSLRLRLKFVRQVGL